MPSCARAVRCRDTEDFEMPVTAASFRTDGSTVQFCLQIRPDIAASSAAPGARCGTDQSGWGRIRAKDCLRGAQQPARKRLARSTLRPWQEIGLRKPTISRKLSVATQIASPAIAGYADRALPARFCFGVLGVAASRKKDRARG